MKSSKRLQNIEECKKVYGNEKIHLSAKNFLNKFYVANEKR